MERKTTDPKRVSLSYILRTSKADFWIMLLCFVKERRREMSKEESSRI
jgi:hypothetical protein